MPLTALSTSATAGIAVNPAIPAWSSQAFMMDTLSSVDERCLPLNTTEILAQRIFVTPANPGITTRIIDTINTLRNSGPKVRQYVDFILAYLEDFTIVVDDDLIIKQGIDKTNWGEGAAYIPVTRTLSLGKKIINDPSLLVYLRHEMRHAFFHALSFYTWGEFNHEAPCFRPFTKAARDKVAGYIKKGNDRVTRLARHLMKEAQGILDPLTQEHLAKLRSLDHPLSESGEYLYPTRTIDISSAELSTMHLGKKGHAKYFGEFTVVGIHSPTEYPPSKTPYIVVFVHDPLKRIVYEINRIKNHINTLPAHQQEYEFDAYLYGDIGQEVYINYFYPELTHYIEQLQQGTMAHPTPLGMAASIQPYTSLLDFQKYYAAMLLANKDYLNYYIKINQVSYLLNIIEQVMPHISLNTYYIDTFKFALNYLLHSGCSTTKTKTNLFLARFSKILKTQGVELHDYGDGLDSCRYYLQAFKQANAEFAKHLFTEQDYLTCIDLLLEAGEWNKARKVAIKARTQQITTNKVVSVALGQRIEKIKRLRSGKQD